MTDLMTVLKFYFSQGIKNPIKKEEAIDKLPVI